jgi:hypothetical protein
MLLKAQRVMILPKIYAFNVQFDSMYELHLASLASLTELFKRVKITTEKLQKKLGTDQKTEFKISRHQVCILLVVINATGTY